MGVEETPQGLQYETGCRHPHSRNGRTSNTFEKAEAITAKTQHLLGEHRTSGYGRCSSVLTEQ